MQGGGRRDKEGYLGTSGGGGSKGGHGVEGVAFWLTFRHHLEEDGTTVFWALGATFARLALL